MAYYPTFCSEYQNTRKVEKLRIHTLDICYSDPCHILTNESEDERSFPDISIKYERELVDCIYMN